MTCILSFQVQIQSFYFQICILSKNQCPIKSHPFSLNS
nr:MAG TPA: hypothetical protein [Caudoviricetes sp.]